MKFYLLLLAALAFIPFQVTAQEVSSAGNTTKIQLQPGQNNPFWPVDEEHDKAFLSAMKGYTAAYRNGLCTHPTNSSAIATCEGFSAGLLQAFLLDIKLNNSKHRLISGQQESFGKGFYDGYAAAWTVANATLSKQNISNTSGTLP
jgi:hypothetical protein